MHHASSSGATNRLIHAKSPYLLQHAYNPVDWREWNAESLAEAVQRNCPILLSIGYSACHWCHVMERESFADTAIAAIMNASFVCIKVDREERPDLDHIYMTALQRMTGQGGWPMTMFLTPHGDPFYGGTYFPPEDRGRMPGFVRVLRSVHTAWLDREADLRDTGSQMQQELTLMMDVPAGADLQESCVLAGVNALLAEYDQHHGGFGGAPKFPPAMLLSGLLRTYQRTHNTELRDMVTTTLTRMATGGLYDQVGGGFHRYSVDERWEIPHFEKMLYDNGPLLALCADAWAQTGDPLHARVVEETASWVLREMQAPEGGYFSSLDADSEGEEGKYYVWDRDEVKALLTPQESALALRRWGFDGAPNFEGRHWHAKVSGGLDEEEAPLLDSARRKLFAAREQRIRPGRDDKVLTSWNALMIEGMAHAARVFERGEWLASAQRAMDFIRRTMWRDGRLLATAKDGRAHLDAYLDDHAFLLAALLELMQAEFRRDDLAFAVELADTLLARFEDRDAGGFFFTAHDHEALIHRPKSGHDNATPSGNGVAAHAMQRLGHLLGDSRYLEAAEKTLRLYWPQIHRSATGFGSLLRALEEALTPPEIIILRGPATQMREWQHALGALPQRLVLALPNGIQGLPVTLAKPESGHVNAWVCRGVTCSAPTENLEELV